MGVIGNIIGFFRNPKSYDSAYRPMYSSVVSALKRQGVKVGGTSFYPRIEVYGITESPRLDKEGSIRSFTFTCESVSNKSIDEAILMNEQNIQLLTWEGLALPEGWRCIGLIPDTLQDATETSDTNKIIYRIIQSFTLWIERIKD